jgi:hypothetical protein
MDNFNIKKFLIENKLTRLSEQDDDDEWNITAGPEWGIDDKLVEEIYNSLIIECYDVHQYGLYIDEDIPKEEWSKDWDEWDVNGMDVEVTVTGEAYLCDCVTDWDDYIKDNDNIKLKILEMYKSKSQDWEDLFNLNWNDGEGPYYVAMEGGETDGIYCNDLDFDIGNNNQVEEIFENKFKGLKIDFDGQTWQEDEGINKIYYPYK